MYVLNVALVDGVKDTPGDRLLRQLQQVSKVKDFELGLYLTTNFKLAYLITGPSYYNLVRGGLWLPAPCCGKLFYSSTFLTQAKSYAQVSRMTGCHSCLEGFGQKYFLGFEAPYPPPEKLAEILAQEHLPVLEAILATPGLAEALAEAHRLTEYLSPAEGKPDRAYLEEAVKALTRVTL